MKQKMTFALCFCNRGFMPGELIYGARDDMVKAVTDAGYDYIMMDKELTRYGDRFDESGDWRIMAARYNYSVNLPEIEYSATSLLPKTSFHLREEYSKLIFRKKPEIEQ